MAFRKLRDMNRIYILRVLEHYQGNRTLTARALGISYRGLIHKLSVYRKQGFKVVENHTSQYMRDAYRGPYK